MATRTRTPKVVPIVDTRADDDAAQKLLAWARGRFGRAVTDVFAWRSPGNPQHHHFALYGKAPALARALGFNGKLANYGLWLDSSLARAFGVEGRSVRNGSATEPFLSHVGDRDEFRPHHILDAVDTALSRHALHVDDDLVHTAILTAPGYPYFGPGTVYFSAATGRHYAAPTPPWEKHAEAYTRVGILKHGIRPVADWCQLARRSDVGVASISLVHGADPPVFVTHSLELGAGWRYEEAALEILRCQGLLFPSFAVGPIPASQFGPCSLFANANIVRRELKPYRERGRETDVVLYATDAFTPVTSEIVTELAAKLYDQLTGRAVSALFMYGEPHLYMNGLVTDDETSEVEGGAPLVTTLTNAVRRLKGRFKVWRGPMTPAQFRRTIEKVTVAPRHGQNVWTVERSPDQFAFLEAKAHVIVPMTAFRLAVVPDAGEGEYRTFLASIGYQGAVQVIALSPEERRAFGPSAHVADEETERARYNYAWRVAAAARAVIDTAGSGVW